MCLQRKEAELTADGGPEQQDAQQGVSAEDGLRHLLLTVHADVLYRHAESPESSQAAAIAQLQPPPITAYVSWSLCIGALNDLGDVQGCPGHVRL